MKTRAGSRQSRFIPERSEDDIRIVLVEDDELYRKAIEFQLKRNNGIRLVAFGSGEDCIRHYHRVDPDILVLDYMLNDMDPSGPVKMNGLELMQRIKAERPGTTVIFLSAQERVEIAAAAIKEGASEYIVKDRNAIGRLQNEIDRLCVYLRARNERAKVVKVIFYAALIFAFALLTNYIFSFYTHPFYWEMLLIAGFAFGLVYTGFFRRKPKVKTHIRLNTGHPAGEGFWLD